MPRHTSNLNGARAMRLGLFAACFAGLGACASGPDGRGIAADPSDPFEGFNRSVFGFNQAVDRAVLRPAAQVYDAVIPDPIQYNVRSFLRNLHSPVIIANNLLQGDGEGAGLAFERFFVNTIVGVGGLIDVAAELRPDLAYRSADFGQTLAIWGVDSGPYLVLPFLGPSNPRDAAGMAVDMAADPVTWALYMNGLTEVQTGRMVLGVIDARVRTLDTSDELEASSLDYYATMRSLYQQYREGQIYGDGGAEMFDIPDFDAPQNGGPQNGTPSAGAPPPSALPDMPDADSPVDQVTNWHVGADGALVAELPAFTMAPVSAVAVTADTGASSAGGAPVWRPTLFSPHQ